MNLFLFIYLVCLFLIGWTQENESTSFNSKFVGNNLIYKRNEYWQKFSKEELIGNTVQETVLINIEKDVTFYLFNKKDPSARQKLSVNDVGLLKKTTWVAGLPTKIFIHGYVANSTVPQMEAMKNTFLERNEDMNIIALDWGPIANMMYPFATHYTEYVGKVGSKLIDFLCENGANPSDFHVIGLSLGAHVAGFVANHVKSGRIARVTGLDPAFLGFITVGKNGRLDKSDANFVDCIHTSGGLVGFMKPLCHADFYPNEGLHPQPGCDKSTPVGIGCSHVRAQDLFTESIEKGHQFPALTCEKLTAFGPNNCSAEGALMGYPAQKQFQGLFYVETGSKYPFAFI